MPNFDCNKTTERWPNGLLPDWCEQQPINEVVLRFNKSIFTLTNSSSKFRICEVRRRISGHATVDTQHFVVQQAHTYNDGTHEDGVSAQIEWSAGTDKGSIELVSAAVRSLDGSLIGLNHAQVVESPGVDGLFLLRVVNHWAVPLYVCFDLTDPGANYGLPSQQLINAGGRWLFWAGLPDEKPTLKWRSAEPQRLSMYGPEPAAESA